MRICIAGASGAFGMKHMDAIAAIEGAEVVSVVVQKLMRLKPSLKTVVFFITQLT